MILTGPEIKKQVEAKRITIEPFNSSQLNPNSYNFTLGKTMIVYRDRILDVHKDNPTISFEIPESGYTLEPDRLYLGHIAEVMGSNYYVPIIRGRSSIGRLGLFINITADLIDQGHKGQWTLQFHAVQPVTIYPGMMIGQVTFWAVEGMPMLYDGKYKNSRGPMASQGFKDFG